MSLEISIDRAVLETDLSLIKDLFREYFDWVRHDLQFDLSYQDVEKELKNLPGAYSPPQGCLLLARSAGQPSGCVALRPNSPGICELKRMYVRPAFRGQGIGRLLCARIIQAARESGYFQMRLDSEISLKTAQKIYSEFGFRSSLPYYEVPMSIRDRTVFMVMELV